LHISQPALSRRLKKLEDAAGVRLFDRTTQKVELTAVGRSFLPYARRLVLELAAAATVLGDVTHLRAGKLAVACIPSAASHFLPGAMRAFTQAHPHIQLRLLDLSSAEVVQSVLHGSAEFGLTFVQSVVHELEFETLFEDPFIAVCGKNHPFAPKKRLTWRDLSQQRVVRVSPRSGSSLLIDIALHRAGIQLHWFHEVEYHFSSALGLTLSGDTITVLPKLALPITGTADLVWWELEEPELCRSLGVVTRRGATLSPAAQTLLDAIRTLSSAARAHRSSSGATSRQ
jgi:DNA-binding transcriptional LysR family regulator